MRAYALIILAWAVMAAGPAAAQTFTFQNGMDGYTGQVNNGMTYGGNCYDDYLTPTPEDDLLLDCPGYDKPGLGDWTAGKNEIEMVSSPFQHPDGESHWNYRTLIVFPGIEAVAPGGSEVVAATLVLSNTWQHVDGWGAPFYISKALQPWTDGDTYWTNWGDGGREPGYTGATLYSGQHVPDNVAALDGGPLAYDLNPVVVQEWFDTPSENYGMLLWHPVGQGYVSQWLADGQDDPAPPTLIVEFREILTLEPHPTANIVMGTIAHEFTSQSGMTHSLQFSLDGGPWVDTGQNVPGDGNVIQLVDPTGYDTGKTYRVIAK